MKGSKEVREYLASIGSKGGKKGGKATGESKVRGDSEYYRNIRKKRATDSASKGQK